MRGGASWKKKEEQTGPQNYIKFTLFAIVKKKGLLNFRNSGHEETQILTTWPTIKIHCAPLEQMLLHWCICLEPSWKWKFCNIPRSLTNWEELLFHPLFQSANIYWATTVFQILSGPVNLLVQYCNYYPHVPVEHFKWG